MRLITIGEVYSLGNGEVIPSIQGQVLKIGKRHEGTNAFGGWSIQMVQISDGQHQIETKVWNKPPFPPHIQGSVISISCSQSDKGPVGVVAKDDPGKGSRGPSRIISADKEAVIAVNGSNIFQGVPVGQASPYPQPAPMPAPQWPLAQAQLPVYQQPPPPLSQMMAPIPDPTPVQLQPARLAQPVPAAPTFAPVPAPVPVTANDLPAFLKKHARLYKMAITEAVQVMRDANIEHGDGVVSEELLKAVAGGLYYAAKDRGFLEVL